MNDEFSYDIVTFPQLDGEIETECVKNSLFTSKNGNQLPEKGGEKNE